MPSDRVPESSLVQRAVAAYIFHPFEPFVLSIQRRGVDFVVSFHFHNMHRHPQPRTTGASTAGNTYMHLLELVSAANICIISVNKVYSDCVLNSVLQQRKFMTLY